MDFEKITADIIADLTIVSQSHPNERLPKEEQIRSRIYASLLKEYKYVNVERGYTAIAIKPTTECDIWAKNKSGEISWLELKRCWSIAETGWNNKPVEQFRSWQADVIKLASASKKDNRVFLLVGVFDYNPASPAGDKKLTLLDKINQFYPKNHCHFSSQPFLWRNTPISHIGVWVWQWGKNKTIDIKNA